MALVSGGNVDLTRVSGVIEHGLNIADTSKGCGRLKHLI